MWLLLFISLLSPTPVEPVAIDVVTADVPYPRGLVLVDDTLYVLARGRVRGAGGVDAALDDRAGTIFAVDLGTGETSAFATPTDPPFRLLDRDGSPLDDTRTDRPYCTLRFDPATQSFFICAFSGIDRDARAAGPDFRKNDADALLRYDLRTERWHEVARHAGGWDYADNQPKGPNNCLVVGRWLYAVGKDNHVLLRHDLAALREDPQAAVGPATLVFGDELRLADGTTERVLGHSALAVRDGFMYVGFRTSGQIVRLPMNDDGTLAEPLVAEVVARFPAWDPVAGTSADITDIAFGPDGRLHVINAQPARVHRFRPDPAAVYDGAAEPAWVNLAERLAKPTLKSENLLVAPDGSVFVTTGDPYGRADGLGGVVYRIRGD